MVIVIQKSHHPAVVDDQDVLIGALQRVRLAPAIQAAHFLVGGDGYSPAGFGWG
jgi:hypothetical protein